MVRRTTNKDAYLVPRCTKIRAMGHIIRRGPEEGGGLIGRRGIKMVREIDSSNKGHLFLNSRVTHRFVSPIASIRFSSSHGRTSAIHSIPFSAWKFSFLEISKRKLKARLINALHIKVDPRRRIKFAWSIVRIYRTICRGVIRINYTGN